MFQSVVLVIEHVYYSLSFSFNDWCI